MTKDIPVSQAFLEEVAQKNSCSTLDTEHPEKSKAKLIRWNGKIWVCVSSMGQYLKTLGAGLNAVVPESLYLGPPFNKNEHLYTGVKFHAERAVWVITEESVLLFPSEDASLFQEVEAKLLSLF